VIYKRYAEVAE